MNLYSTNQISTAEMAAETLRKTARDMLEIDMLVSKADFEVRDLDGYGTVLDALAEIYLPAWRVGTRTKPGMSRRQWSAIRIPDPNSSSLLAFPRGGLL